MLASVFTDGSARVPLTDYFDALFSQISSLRGVELVEVHNGDAGISGRDCSLEISLPNQPCNPDFLLPKPSTACTPPSTTT